MWIDRDNPASGGTTPILSIDDAKLFLRVDQDVDDALLAQLIEAATKVAQASIGQQFITATYNGYLDGFPARDYIEVELPPLQSVGYVKYYDTAGDLQTLSTDLYSADTTRKPGRIQLAYGQTWASTYAVPNAVDVQFTCGYGDAASDIPRTIVLAVKTLVYDYYYQRSSVGSVPMQAYRLLSTSAHGAA
jgi:uncharacterized phiE125 gp8 family phage protein